MECWQKGRGKNIKKCLLCFRTADFQFSLEFVLNYSALVESQQAAVESQAAESATTSSTTAASSTTATESVASALLLAALFPQDAKETAAKATNKNTNFFHFLCFLNL